MRLARGLRGGEDPRLGGMNLLPKPRRKENKK